MFKIESDNYITTLLAPLRHFSAEDLACFIAMPLNDVSVFPGVDNVEIMIKHHIFRDQIADVLTAAGVSSYGVELIDAISEKGFDAVILSGDTEPLHGVPWFTDDGAKVIPLGYGLEITQYYDLTPDQKHYVHVNIDESAEDDGDQDYFVHGEDVYSLSDVMRLGDDSVMGVYGFTGYIGETNTSALFVAVSGDGDTVDLARVIG